MKAQESALRTTARAHERRVLRASVQKDFSPLGTFVSSAPRTRLLAALKQLKPQLDLHLRALGAERYRVEIETRDLRRRHLIDIWLGVKGALASAFPENKPDGVRRMQP